MDKTEAEITDALKQLDLEYALAVDTDFETLNCTIFLVTFGGALRKLKDSTRPEIQKALVNNWLRHQELCLRNKSVPDFLRKSMDPSIELMLKNNMVDELTSNLEKTLLFSAFCLRRVYHHENGFPIPDITKFIELLSTWSGLDVSPECFNTMSDMIRWVYGEGVYEICKSEPDWNTHSLLWSHKIVPRFKKELHSKPRELPSDVS